VGGALVIIFLRFFGGFLWAKGFCRCSAFVACSSNSSGTTMAVCSSLDLQVHVELLGGIVIGGLKYVSALCCIQYIATSTPRVESGVVRDIKT
jgi:hypothetical protein